MYKFVDADKRIKSLLDSVGSHDDNNFNKEFGVYNEETDTFIT